MEDLCKEFVPVSDNKCSIKICGTSPRMLELLVKFCRGGNTKQAFLDVKLFLRKLRRYLAKQIDITAGQQSFNYITIAEPQGERHGNSWHMHILLIFEDIAPFIENEMISELWSHGITWYPEGYTPGAGSGFIPGEPFPE